MAEGSSSKGFDAQASHLSSSPKHIYGISTVILASVFALALCEVALRIADWPAPTTVGWKWRGHPFVRNEFGFKGHKAKFKADTTVLLLGDSQVESTGRFEQMAEVYLGEALEKLMAGRVRVVSMGARGWGQDQQLLALKEHISSIRPQVVALWFTPGNDLWNNTFPTHKNEWAKPTFWLENGELRGPNTTWMASFHRRSLYLLSLLDKARGTPMLVTDEEWEDKLPQPYLAPPLGGTYALSLKEFLAKQRGVPKKELASLAIENFTNEKTHFSIGLYPRSPRLDYSVKLTRRLLVEILKVCRTNGAELVVFYQETPPDYPKAPTDFEVAGRRVTLSWATRQALIDEVLSDVPSIVIKGLPSDSTVSKTDSRLNNRGNEYMMSKLAHWLVDDKVLPSEKHRAGIDGRPTD